MAHGLLPDDVLWLATTPPADDLVAALDALLRVAGDIDARLSAQGMQGTAGVLAAHRRLRAVLDALRVDDVVATTAAVTAVRAWVETVSEQLERLRAIKARWPE